MAILKPGQLASGSYTISGSFSGSFQGSGAGLNNIPSSAIVGLSSTQIASGAVTASVSTGTGSFTVTSGSSTFMFISSSGNVGLGTTTPAYKLDISGSTQITGTTIISAGTNSNIRLSGGGIEFSRTIDGAFNTYITKNGSTNSVGLTFAALNSGTFIFQGSSEIMRMSSTGNVLIGTTVDGGFKFDVNGTARVSGNFTSNTLIGSGTMTIAQGNYTINFAATGKTPIIFDLAGASNQTLVVNAAGANVTNLIASGNSTVAKSMSTTALVSGLDASTSGWTSVPIRPGQPLGNANNAAGVNLLLQGGQGTGTGAGGNILFQVKTADGAGSQGLSVLSTVAQINQTTGNVLINTTTDTGHKLTVSGSGTSGSLNVDNTLYVSGSRVGIGTSLPANRLSVITSAGGNIGGFSVGSSVGLLNIWGGAFSGVVFDITNGALNGSTGTDLLIRQGGVTVMELFQTGNLLIQNGGTFTDAGFRLDVNGTARVQGNFQVSAGVARFTSTIYPNIEVNSTQRYSIIEFLNTQSAKAAVALDNTDKYLDLSGYPTYGVRFNVNNTEAARFNNSTKNLLINTTTDAGFRLDVNGTARVQGNATFSTNLSIGTTATPNKVTLYGDAMLIKRNGANLNVGLLLDDDTKSWQITANRAQNSLNIYDNTAATNRFIVSSAGNILINTTTDAGYRLDVNGTARIVNDAYINSKIRMADGTAYITGAQVSGQGANNAVNFYFNNGSTWVDDTNVSAFSIRYNQGIRIPNTSRYPLTLGSDTKAAASAQLEMVSTTQGFLPPRMTGAQAEAISSPAEGLMVYSTDGSGVTITSKGWWGYNGATWEKLN